MDLELIGKKMLEALAVQGQVASVQTKLLDLQGGITKADGLVKQSQETKASTVKARGQAEGILSAAIDDAGEADLQVIQAKANLKSAKLVVGKAEEEVDKYNDVVLGQLDEFTQQLQEAKQAVEAERDVVQKELEGLKKDLGTRLAELKASGVELNLGGTATRSKTTTL